MNKGFTLVETLAAIVILSGIILIAIPSYNGISNSIKKTNYDNKIKSIESAMLKYANVYLLDDIKPTNCKTTTCKKSYDLYDDIVYNGIIEAEKYDNNEPIIINPLTNERITGKVELTFKVSDATLTAKFIQ